MGMIIPDTNFQSAGETMEHPCLRRSKRKGSCSKGWMCRAGKRGNQKVTTENRSYSEISEDLGYRKTVVMDDEAIKP